MPEGVGYTGDESHDEIVREIVELEAFYREQLGPMYRRMSNWWRLYLADRPDKRGEHEKWRANVFVPYPYSGVETVVASVSDIMNSADPIIQAEGVGFDDEQNARGIERHIDYTLRKNHWPKTQDLLFRSMAIQGTVIPKLVFAKRSHNIYVHPSQQQVDDFKLAVQQAQMAGAVPPPADPAEFALWRELVNKAGTYGKIPEPPVPGPRQIVEYHGPVIERVQIYDLRFDPLVDDMQQQRLVIHRMVKPRKWLLERTGPEPWKPFSPEAVENAMRRAEEARLSEWENEVAEMLGITNGNSDPSYDDAVEIWECWRLGSPAPYCVILNRQAIINKTPTQLPYWHGQLPFIPIRNVSVPGHLLGISELQQPEKLYHEMNALRNLRLDAVTLAVLPMFMKQKDMGIPELQRFIKPGAVWETSNPKGMAQLNQFGSDIANAFRELDAIKGDIDETNATPSHLRGSPSTVGRVSATEAERRFSQALVRQKQRVLRIEDELQPMVRQMLMLWYQFSDTSVRVRIGDGKDPFVDLPRDAFLEALDMDYRFRGASKSLNKDLQVQQLMGFLRDNRNDLVPRERRRLMARIYETMGQKGVGEIISKEGTAALEGAALAAAAAAARQAAPGGGGEMPMPGGEAAPAEPALEGAPA